MAYKVEVGIEITCCDSCICEVAVFCLSKERICFVGAFSTVATSIRVPDKFNVSVFTAGSLKNLAFADKGTYSQGSLVALCSFLKDDFVCSFLESLC